MDYCLVNGFLTGRQSANRCQLLVYRSFVVEMCQSSAADKKLRPREREQQQRESFQQITGRSIEALGFVFTLQHNVSLSAAV